MSDFKGTPPDRPKVVKNFGPSDLGLPDRRPFAIVKLQTVETIPLREASNGPSVSVGQAIDEILDEAKKNGLVPNRLSIDLNPRTANPADVDSF